MAGPAPEPTSAPLPPGCGGREGREDSDRSCITVVQQRQRRAGAAGQGGDDHRVGQVGEHRIGAVEAGAGAEQRDRAGVAAVAVEAVGACPRRDGQADGRAGLVADDRTGGRQIFDRALFVSGALTVTRRALPGTAGSRRDIVRRPAIRKREMSAPPYRRPKISPQGIQRTLIGAGMSSRIVTNGDGHDARSFWTAARSLARSSAPRRNGSL